MSGFFKTAAKGAYGKASRGASSAYGGASRMGGRGMRSLQGTSAYQGARTSLKQRADLSLSYGSIVLITALAASYLVVASLGIDTFTNKCKELVGVKTQENLNKWLIATLAIAITIPCTLLTVRLAGKKLQGLMMLLFGILGIVASSAVIHWNRKCETPESEKIYGGINMAVFIVMLLAAVYLLQKKYVGTFHHNNTPRLHMNGIPFSGPLQRPSGYY